MCCFRGLRVSYFYSNDGYVIVPAVQNSGWSVFLKENHRKSGTSCRCHDTKPAKRQTLLQKIHGQCHVKNKQDICF